MRFGYFSRFTAVAGFLFGLTGTLAVEQAEAGHRNHRRHAHRSYWRGPCKTRTYSSYRRVVREETVRKDIVDTAASADSFNTLVAAVKAAGLVETLKGKGPFTVFAPSDAAFAKLPEGTLESLLKPENKEQLQAILTYHVVPGRVLAADVVKLRSAKTAQGQSVSIQARDGMVKVDNANVVKTDILASNGVIHVIDAVILPESQPDIVETAVSAGSFKTLVAAVQAAGLVETLQGKGPFTVFAPTDEAFAKLPEGTVEELLKPENKKQLQAILTYHVVPGKVLAKDVVKLASAKTVQGQEVDIRVDEGTVMIDNAKVVKTDIETSNGVIHVIDAVILPESQPDIVETAVSAGSFKTLVAAVQAAGLVETLQGKGPFTVFAPTDEAFAKLPEGTVEELLKPENKKQLQAILTYHVVPGKVLAKDVVKLASAKTVQGQELTVRSNDRGVMVDNANVIKTDIETSNGVIHVIDAVVLPE